MNTTKFSTAWRASTQPRKQHLYRYRAPLHIAQKFLHVHLSKELRQKYSIRSLRLRKGDKVKIVRGQFKKKEARVEKITVKGTKVLLEGIQLLKKDGSKVSYPIDPSNLVLIDLDLSDKKRKEKLGSSSPETVKKDTSASTSQTKKRVNKGESS